MGKYSVKLARSQALESYGDDYKQELARWEAKIKSATKAGFIDTTFIVEGHNHNLYSLLAEEFKELGFKVRFYRDEWYNGSVVNIRWADEIK